MAAIGVASNALDGVLRKGKQRDQSSHRFNKKDLEVLRKEVVVASGRVVV